jgi:hypothetical protein
MRVRPNGSAVILARDGDKPAARCTGRSEWPQPRCCGSQSSLPPAAQSRSFYPDTALFRRHLLVIKAGRTLWILGLGTPASKADHVELRQRHLIADARCRREVPRGVKFGEPPHRKARTILKPSGPGLQQCCASRTSGQVPTKSPRNRVWNFQRQVVGCRHTRGLGGMRRDPASRSRSASCQGSG